MLNTVVLNENEFKYRMPKGNDLINGRSLEEPQGLAKQMDDIGVTIDPRTLQKEGRDYNISKLQKDLATKEVIEDNLAYSNAVANGYTGPKHDIAIPEVNKINYENSITPYVKTPFEAGQVQGGLNLEANLGGNYKGQVEAVVPAFGGKLKGFATTSKGVYVNGPSNINNEVGLAYIKGNHSFKVAKNKMDNNDSTNAQYTYRF